LILFSHVSAAMARKWGASGQGFTYLLIGKDGGVKARAREAVPLDEVFRQIDSMPMRQQEMRG
jgi:hypothetical protein